MFIREMITKLEEVQVELTNTVNRDYCKAVYDNMNKLKNHIDIDVPYVVVEMIDKIQQKAHERYTELMHYELDNVEYRCLKDFSSRLLYAVNKSVVIA